MSSQSLFFAATVFSLFLLSVTIAQAPIPGPKPDGFVLGDPSKAIIHVNLWADLSCPTCADFFNKVFPDLYNYYFNTTIVKRRNEAEAAAAPSGPGDILLTIHFFPLPFRIAAYDASLAANIVSKYAPESLLPFIRNVYANQAIIDNDNLDSVSRKDYRQVIFDKFVKQYGVSQADYSSGLTDYNLVTKTRVGFKYGCTRGVFGTPAFFVNGVQVFDGPSRDAAAWKRLFDSIKQQQ